MLSNIHADGPYWRVWLDGKEVSTSAWRFGEFLGLGWVDVYEKNERGHFTYNKDIDGVKWKRRYGRVRWEKTERSELS